MLTGENYDVEKVVDPVKRKDAQLQDKNNIIFSGTNVTRGKCRGIVIGTGLATEKGKIRDQIQVRFFANVKLGVIFMRL